MKFGALLRNSSREVPELQGLFDCYKQLKKRLKRLPVRDEHAVVPNADVLEHERAFVALLVADIQAFNDTFVEREEQSVIQLSLLEERATGAREPEDIANVYKSFVDFHGQTLLLVHWSILAYTSVLKILKKHYKRTGLRVQEFNAQHLLAQPFCSVELISGLVRKAEDKAQELAGRLNPGMGQASLSAASPGSSPVAELIDAARASVQQIAESAARGDEELDRQLGDGPTSSDEGSAEVVGNAEVVSGPSRSHGAMGRPQGTEEAENAGNGLAGNSTANGHGENAGKRKPEQHTAVGVEPPAKQPRGGELGTEAAPGAGLRLLRRTESACDSEHPAAGPPGENEAVGAPGEGQNGGVVGALPIQSSGSPHKASESPTGGPQLTMGQGWGQQGPQNILRQTQMALGLWEELHYTASTPSTVVPPLQDSKAARGSANSAA